MSAGTVNREITKARSEYRSSIGAIVSLESTGQIPRELLTEGLDFDKYLLLTHREKDVLDSILKEDAWVISNTPQGIRRHLMNIYSKLGVQNRTQAVIYGIFLPEEIRNEGQKSAEKPCLTLSPIDSDSSASLTTGEEITSQQFADMLERVWEIENDMVQQAKLLRVSERSALLGFNLESIRPPGMVFTPKSEYPGKGVAPQTSEFYRHRFASEALTSRFKTDIIKEVQYWELIREGRLPQNAATLSGNWVLIEGIQRPNYERGEQMYLDDPLAPYLAEWRKQGRIQTPDWCKVPLGSRFGVSVDEIKNVVIPHVANQVGVSESQVSLLRAIEFNVIGNIAHPEWGETSTWEWLADTIDDKYHLIGGYRDPDHVGILLGSFPTCAGLGNLEVNEFCSRDDNIGFRLMINSPQQKAA
jgi:hypothetical protein